MNSLTSAQRKYLRGLAHKLSPVAQVGKNGLTAVFIDSMNEQLAVHELIKIKFLDFKDEKEELVSQMAQSTKSECAGIIGHIAILYRPHAEPQKRKIILPDSKSVT